MATVKRVECRVWLFQHRNLTCVNAIMFIFLSSGIVNCIEITSTTNQIRSIINHTESLDPLFIHQLLDK